MITCRAPSGQTSPWLRSGASFHPCGDDHRNGDEGAVAFPAESLVLDPPTGLLGRDGPGSHGALGGTLEHRA
jgi:hypothetical protein